MDILVQIHIRKRALQVKKNVPPNCVEVLKEIENSFSNDNIKIRFSFLKDGGATFINATSIIKGYVLFNAEWAAMCILFNDNDTRNAFIITLGHELTHKDGDFKKKLKNKIDKQFIYWINEVHADFGGVQKTYHSSRRALVNSCEYKYNYKIKQKREDEDKTTHPSWQRRKEYAEKYNFDETLIKRIANDTGCNNATLIEQAISFYDKIILR